MPYCARCGMVASIAKAVQLRGRYYHQGCVPDEAKVAQSKRQRMRPPTVVITAGELKSKFPALDAVRRSSHKGNRRWRDDHREELDTLERMLVIS